MYYSLCRAGDAGTIGELVIYGAPGALGTAHLTRLCGYRALYHGRCGTHFYSSVEIASLGLEVGGTVQVVVSMAPEPACPYIWQRLNIAGRSARLSFYSTLSSSGPQDPLFYKLFV